jgi:hypothetical protein
VAFQARRSSSDWKNGGGGVDPKAPSRAVKATWEKRMEMKDRRSQLGEDDGSSGPKKDTMREKPKATSDIKLKDATITVLTEMKGRKEGEWLSPFKPSRRLQRSSIAGRKGRRRLVKNQKGVKYPLGLATRVRR